MARGSSIGRPRRGPRWSHGGRGGRRVVLAGRGDGWELWVPEDVWSGLSDQERADLAGRQGALLDGAALASTERRPRSAGPVIAGAPDQLTLFGGRP